MSKVGCSLSELNYQALVLSEEAGAVASLFDHFRDSSELQPGSLMDTAEHERGMYCLIRCMARHFETEFSKIADELLCANPSSSRKPKAKKVTKEVKNGEEGEA